MHWSSAPGQRARFSDAERDRRWKRVRQEMARAQVDLLIVVPQPGWIVEDAMYLADEVGAVLFPLEGEPTILIGGEGAARQLRADGWITDRVLATESNRIPFGQAAAARLRGSALARRRVAIAGLRGGNLSLIRVPEGYVSYTAVAELKAGLPDTEIVDGTDIIGAARHQKSEEEIELLGQAVQVAEASVALMARRARPAAEQAEVYGEMLLEQLRWKAEPMAAWCAGHWGEDRWRFTTTPPGLIEPDWYISLEVGPGVRGYFCQIAEPVVVGEPNAEAKRIFELNLALFSRACELMRPSSTWGEVEAGTKEVVAGTEYAATFLLHGRGMGSSLDGPLLIPTDSHDHVRDLPVELNSTFILKPHAFPKASGWPKMRNLDVTWGDTVVVREHGAERLGTRPMRLVQAPD